jgi:AraC family transcriptional regulator
MVDQVEDDMMANFARVITPAVERPHEANALFFAHLFSAVRIHLIRRYGRLKFSTPRGDGKLAVWQERRVLDMLQNGLGEDITIEAVAAECGLSPAYFARAFKASFGRAPHQWQLAYRIEHTKHMLATTEQSIVMVALTCGFADQSHLTRIFSKAVGHGPAAWRRAQKQ